MTEAFFIRFVRLDGNEANRSLVRVSTRADMIIDCISRFQVLQSATSKQQSKREANKENSDEDNAENKSLSFQVGSQQSRD